MNKDLSLTLHQSKTYFDMLNFRIVSADGLSTGNPQNAKGNLLQLTIPTTSPLVLIQITSTPGATSIFNFTIIDSGITTIYSLTITSSINPLQDIVNYVNNNIPNVHASIKDNRVVLFGILTNNINTITNIVVSLVPTGYTITIIVPALSNLKILGWELIREEIFLFTCSDPADTYGQIWKFTYDKVDNTTYTIELIYNNQIDLSLDFPIANPGGIIGNYEGSSIKRLYWTDNNNIPRVINTADTELMALNPNNLNLQPLSQFSIPILNNILNGSLLTGLYQYAYRLSLTVGGETVFSQASSLIPVNIHPEGTTPYIEYIGSNSGVNSGKSLQLTINNVDTNYDTIEIISLYYPDSTSIPIIEIIKSEPVPASGIFTFIHSGTEIGIPVTLDEFNIINTVILRCKTIASKMNYLFLGNLKESIFDVEWDARAYRFNTTQGIVVDSTGLQTTVIPNTGVYPDQWNVPETHDAINPNPDVTTLSLTGTNDPYIYQSNNTTFGGEGANIKYEFVTQQTVFDSYSQTPNHLNSGVYLAPIAETTRSPLSYNYDNYTRVNQNNTFTDFHSPYLEAQLKGYTRGETYRFGIVFFDLQGNQSYVKWIGDIQFPHSYMPDVTNIPLSAANKKLLYPTTDVVPGNIQGEYANNLGLKFTINNIPNGISGFSIVRCERKSQDKKVLGQGLFQIAYQGGDPLCTSETFLVDDGVGTLNNSPLAFPIISSNGTFATTFIPEHLFGLEDFTFQQGDQVELVGRLESRSSFQRAVYQNSGANNCTIVSSKIYNIKNYSWSTTPLTDIRIQTGAVYNALMPLTGTKTLVAWSANPNAYNASDVGIAGTQAIWNVSTPRSIDPLNHGCYRDSYNQGINSLLLGSNSGPFNGFGRFLNNPGGLNRYTTDGIAATQNMYLINYLRNVTNQYGGNTYSQRANSEYISCGHYQPITNSTTYSFSVFGGDTYICLFDLMPRKKHYTQGDGFSFSFNGTAADQNPAHQVVSGHAGNNSTSTALIRYFPVETAVNIYLRNTASNIGYNCTTSGGGVPQVAVPNKGNFDDGVNIFTATPSLLDTQDEFIYNSIYSKENNIRVFFPKPPVVTTDGVHDTRVRVSQQKINNELTDSWTIFKEADYLDADTIQGSITNFMVHQDRLVVFQEKGISVASVNERSLIQDNTGADLVLGTGGVLTRFDYISKIIGSIHQFGFTQNNESVFFFDMRSKNLYQLTGTNPVAISESKGLDSFFTGNLDGSIQVIDNPYRNNGITATYDFKYNEAIFSFLDSIETRSQSILITYTIAYNDFTDSWETFFSFVPPVYINDKRNIFSTTTKDDLWIHDKGLYGNFYGTQYPSTITMIVNEAPSESKVFDNYELTSESINSLGNNVPNDTFNTIQIYTDFMNTGIQQLSNFSKRKERTWNISGLRNIVDYTIQPPNIFTNIFSTPYPPFLERIRDKYSFIKLTYNNTDNNKLILNTFKTSVRKSAR